ncbi:hypothetical protein UT300005_04690 [Clostridium sp. CTA-5]
MNMAVLLMKNVNKLKVTIIKMFKEIYEVSLIELIYFNLNNSGGYECCNSPLP